MLTSNVALKEWETVVQGLASGKQLFLLRKGGIRDPKGAFELQHREFLLYPTREHEKESAAELLRSEFLDRPPARAAAAPSEIELSVYAGVAYVGELRDPSKLAKLERYHVWTPEFFKRRIEYRPKEPTLVVAVRAYQLLKPVRLPERPEYAGCKSWVTLSEQVPVEGATPGLDNARFRQALEAIHAAVGR